MREIGGLFTDRKGARSLQALGVAPADLSEYESWVRDPEWEVYEPVPPLQLSEAETAALLTQEAGTKKELGEAEEEQEVVQKTLHAAQRAMDGAKYRELMPRRDTIQEVVQRLTRRLEALRTERLGLGADTRRRRVDDDRLQQIASRYPHAVVDAVVAAYDEQRDYDSFTLATVNVPWDSAQGRAAEPATLLRVVYNWGREQRVKLLQLQSLHGAGGGGGVDRSGFIDLTS